MEAEGEKRRVAWRLVREQGSFAPESSAVIVRTGDEGGRRWTMYNTFHWSIVAQAEEALPFGIA